MTLQVAHSLTLALLPGERWWGGAVADGQAMPFGSSHHHRDLATSAGFLDDPDRGGNQSAPLLLSNRGRSVWSEEPFAFTFDSGALTVDGGGGVVVADGAADLAGAFRAAAAAHFPAAGTAPAEAMFTGPQYNTWIELPYLPDQTGVLRYVEGLLEAGFPPGVVMIDDRWSQDYGTWRFEPGRFPDPAAMVARLHDLGCPVMLWLVPFVSPDSDTFRALGRDGLLVRGRDGEPVVRRWWNGYSAMLDVTGELGVAWLRGELDALVRDVGVDGFKFDAGDLRHYDPDDVLVADAGATGWAQAWARIGVQYPFNEYRACWKMGGQPLAQRLHDKPQHWGPGGLASLIPEAIAQGLIGLAFNCPDMIGGGDLGAFGRCLAVDQELFVRYAQCAALFPMMQFSMSPSRVLDADHLGAVLDVVRLRQSLVPEILALVRQAAVSGEPVLRPLAYHFDGYDDVRDQFLLGDRILVAPVLQPGAASRTVALPPGRWEAADGVAYDGPTEVTLDVGLASLPWFRRVGAP